MKVVGLVSGGKDSCFNMMHCVANGHEIVALANLYSRVGDRDNVEIDSYMYQTVGTEVVPYIAEAMDVPLFRQRIERRAVVMDLVYVHSNDDEVEDLLLLLERVKLEFPDLGGVSVGAILSDYQRTRVEHVCARLQLQVFAYLWQMDQGRLLKSMVDSALKAVVVKTAAMGLGRKHIGMDLAELGASLESLPFGHVLNPCGEGGEYETITLDCPLFKRKVVLEDYTVQRHSDDDIAPGFSLCNARFRLAEKVSVDGSESWRESLHAKSISRVKFTQPPCGWDLSIAAKERELSLSSDALLSRYRLTDSFLSVFVEPEIKSEVEAEAAEVMERLESKLKTLELCAARDLVLVQLFVSDMADFASVNRVYRRFFAEQPPARVCVQVAKSSCKVWLSALVTARKQSKSGLHVQSISYWAPANIGPYSQSVQCGDLVFMAGQIGMVPQSLEVFTAGPLLDEIAQSLENVSSVAQLSHTSLSSAIGAICYLAGNSDFSLIRHVWNEQMHLARVPLVIARVSGLPKGSRLEWQPLFLKDQIRASHPATVYGPERCTLVYLNSSFRTILQSLTVGSRAAVATVQLLQCSTEGVSEVETWRLLFLNLFLSGNPLHPLSRTEFGLLSAKVFYNCKKFWHEFLFQLQSDALTFIPCDQLENDALCSVYLEYVSTAGVP